MNPQAPEAQFHLSDMQAAAREGGQQINVLNASSERSKLQRVEHDLADHLEHLRFEHVRLNFRIATALNERWGMHRFLRPPVTLVSGLVVDATLSAQQFLPDIPSV
jgi:hypothetical protein